MVTASTSVSKARVAKKGSAPDFQAQAEKINTILSDPDKKALILGLKDFQPLTKIASFSPADLTAFAKEHPALARTIIGAYGDEP
jgi:hypothetical protein